jgi:hypothetical protein
MPLLFYHILVRAHPRQDLGEALIVATTTPPEDITAALNVTPFDPEAFEVSFQLHRCLATEERRLAAEKTGRPPGILSRLENPRELLGRLGLIVSGAVDDAELEKRIVSSRLRRLVDEWLATGQRSDGGESPAQKDVFRTAGAIEAVEDYVYENPVQVTIERDLSVVLVWVSTRVFVDFFQKAINQADRLFTVLMLSVWKNQLCKCRYAPCGQYFRRLKKPRSFYRHGTFCCPEHQRRASATPGTKKFRAWAEQVLIESAAQQLLNWGMNSPRWQNDARRKQRLAEELCRVIKTRKLCSYRKKVTANWVNRRLLAIEKRRARLPQWGGLTPKTLGETLVRRSKKAKEN